MAESKLLELVSVLGVGIIGFGLGALFVGYFKQYAVPIIGIGVLMHGLSMYKIHSESKKESSWMKLLYWLCWVILAGLMLSMAINLL